MGKLITRMVDKSKDTASAYRKAKNEIMQRYFGLYMTSYDVPEIDHIAKEYMLMQFWIKGTVAAYNLPFTNELAFSGYAPYGNLGQYGVFRKFTLINEFGLSENIVPTKVFTRDKNIAIGYACGAHIPVSKIVSEQVDRILNVRIAIDNNLDINKLAFILKTSVNNKSRLEKEIEKVLSGAKAIAVNQDDYSAITTPDKLQANFIVDKLRAYEKDLENDLLTFLGINNMGMSEKKERAITDEVKSNNELIARYGNSFKMSLNEFVKDIKKTLDKTITFTDPVKEEIERKEKEAAENGKQNSSNLQP